MKCCRHPIVSLLTLKGFRKQARTVEAIIHRFASETSGLAYYDKLDLIESVVLNNLTISPKSAKILAAYLYDVLNSEVIQAREWSSASQAVKLRINQWDTEIEEKVQSIKQLSKLKSSWKYLQEVASGQTSGKMV